MIQTLNELMDRLRQQEETYLVELLNLRSSEIVDRFTDRIEDFYDELCAELEELTDDESE